MWLAFFHIVLLAMPSKAFDLCIEQIGRIQKQSRTGQNKQFSYILTEEPSLTFKPTSSVVHNNQFIVWDLQVLLFQRDDTSLLAQFFYADDSLNLVAAELDSFDGRKDPERCSSLVNHLRQCQDKVSVLLLSIRS